MNHAASKAFTLVELIVVITIVGILSTIGFVSYSNYLTGARDSNRIAQMIKISESLQIFASKNSLPLPDNKVDITASGMIIASQGYIGTQVLETIDYSDGGLDPKDDTPFTYMVSKDRKSLQLLALMEESQTVRITTQSYAGNYENRYPKVYGQKLGVLTDTTNTPIQELSISGSTLDILTTTLKLKSYLTESEYIVDNLATLQKLQDLVPENGKFWRVVDNAFVYTGTDELAGGNPGGLTSPQASRYPGCDTDDITVGNYIVSACNVGATTASLELSTNSSGFYFQWGRNKGFLYNDILPGQPTTINGSTGLNASTDTYGFVTSTSLPEPYTWANTNIENNWGHTTNTNIARQGPCAPGYHVPSLADWQGMVNAGGWGMNGAAMQTDLQLPHVGEIDWYSSNWDMFINGYWTSTPLYDGAATLEFSTNFISIDYSYNRAYGFPVRCFKN